MDYDESSDILGGRLHVSPQTSSPWSDPGQITLFLSLGLAAFYTWARLAPHYRQWKETRYKKATRRRHGIPDDDNRPFNVAYAAALQAKKQREGKGRPYLRDGPELVAGEEGDRVAPSGLPSVPSFVKPVACGNGYPLPSVKAETSQSILGPRPDVPTLHSASQRDRIPQTLPRSLSNGSAARKPSGAKQSLATRTSYGKHALAEESDSELEMLVKKSRVEGEELIDGDEQAEWHGSDEDMEVDEAQPVKRGSKRVASSEGDEGLDHSRTVRRDKRARKVSLDKSLHSPDESMGEDLEDGVEDVEDNARGKKRDRMEAGSTFGGDDYMMDDEGEKPKRRRRKGRVSNKLEETLSRGQKRGRGSHSTESDDSESERPRQRVARKKRGRKSQEDIIPLSNDPLCKGRPIGEEWESHGILFKVGPNGQRLRQELVKKSRSKFPMPSDSQHPDRRAHVDVYVEVWLSEEEYKLAKERHELAWQDSSPTPPELRTPSDVPESPSKVAGKNLLWSSTISSRDSPVKRGPLKQSVTTNAGSRLTIFPPPPAISTRRISSVYHPPASPAAESPKLQKTKSYSKWEKQDLEAAAMSKIRDRQQSARVGNGTKPSPLSAMPSTAPAAPTPTAAPPLVGAPSTAASSAPEKPPTSTAPSTFNFPPSSTATAAPVIKPSTTELPKISTAPATVTTSTAPSKPAATFLFAPAAPSSAPAAPASVPQVATPQTGTSIPNFFAKPAAPAAAAAAPASTTSSLPNFFAKPAAPQGSTPSTTAPTTSAPTSTASKPTFGFGVPAAQQATTTTVSPFGSASSDSTKAMEQAKATPGASLLSRIGMGPPPSQPAAPSPFAFAKPETAAPAASTTSDSAKTSTPTSAAAASGPLKFNFGVASKPLSTSSTPSPAMAAPAIAPAAPSASAPTPAPASSTPKFSFGVTSSSQPAAASSAPTNPFATTNTATPSSAVKSPFSFGASGTPTSTPGPFSGASSSTPTFGAPSGTSNAPSPFGAAVGNAAKPAESAKTTFGFGPTSGAPSTSNASPFAAPASSVSSSPFGASAAGSAPSPFGAPAASSAPSPFGAPAASSGPSPFGAASSNTTKPAEAPKSAFSFGNSGTSSSAAPSAFGNTAQKTDTQAAKPLFGFGASSTPAPTFGATSGPASQDSKPTFGFGAPAGGTTGAAPAAPAAPFSFNFGQSSSATNSSSTPAASTPQTSGQGSGSFSFGAPSGGAFSFGSNSGQSQQK